ncbi:RND transporter MFP subunit [Fulvitalea axinellae]|uniref:RND transporter MFP subunit n=1 Tax=Fulvitalea axinellae TaxID=1182444 RepID=A0AAU9C9X2_9BACT|nr:RND transporter MFP subunit [Fulvitalea axinellae]
MKKILYIFLGIALLGAVAGMFYYLYAKSQEKPVVFETESPFKTNIVKKTVATGAITPRKEIEVKSHVSGVVDELFTEAGDVIKKGQLIARIKVIPDVARLNQAESNVKTARINFENAEREYKRQKGLFDQQVISKQEFNEFEVSYKLREQELDAAKDNLQIVKEGATKKKGSVSNLVYSTAEGMVLEVPVKEGNFVIESNTFNDGTTLASVANMGEMIFEGKVDESEVGKIKEGMKLKLKVAALQSESFDALLEFISPKGKEEEGAVQFEVKAAVTLKDSTFLRSGYSANADIVLDHRDSVMAIKESLLIFDKEDGKTYVEVETTEQEFEKREVKTGLSDGINIEVLKGVEKEDKIKKQK